VVVFSLPGAFTPTCSSTHLPRYNELAPAFFANGVDEIVCVSVNDTFVMNEWGKDQESQNVRLIPDGNGEFTEQVQFIEPEKEGDPFEVSDADTMLNFINPQAKKPDQVAIFTREGCSFCAKAKAKLTELGYDYVEIPLAHQIRSKVIGAVTGQQTVPQVFINGEHIGDAEALEQWARKAA
jgi:glutaredoxin-like protein